MCEVGSRESLNCQLSVWFSADFGLSDQFSQAVGSIGAGEACAMADISMMK